MRFPRPSLYMFPSAMFPHHERTKRLREKPRARMIVYAGTSLRGKKTQPSARCGMRRQAYARIAGRMRASAPTVTFAHVIILLRWGRKNKPAPLAAPLEKGTPWDFSIYSAEASIKSSNRPALPKTCPHRRCAPRRIPIATCRAENVPLDAIGPSRARHPIFVYCQSGRSSQAARLLESRGFLDVTNLGGIMSYRGPSNSEPRRSTHENRHHRRRRGRSQRCGAPRRLDEQAEIVT